MNTKRNTMRIWIAAAALAAISTAANAEPKTITLDGCVKVESEMKANVDGSGSRSTMTVKCTGEANDPKVREENKTTLFSVSGGAILCSSDGKTRPC